MPDDLNDLLLASDATIEELMALAKKLPTERIQVLALAAALAYVAEDGGVPNAFRRKGGQGGAEDGQG
jgi:hypothetical protein